jgi:opacity protein-like surface antigen
MRRSAWIFVVLLATGTAEAQTTVPQQRFDVGATAGLMAYNPSEQRNGYGDDWIAEGRYAVSFGRYWTDHLKTEIEFSTSGDAERYTQRFVTVPGVPPGYSISAQEHYRLHQLSARVVWQFRDNQWVHPYVFGGASYDIERKRVFVPEQHYWGGDARTPAFRIPITPPIKEGPETTRRAGVIAGGGTKLYMTSNSYFNAGAVVSYAKPSTTFSLVAGFGIDF